MYVYVCICIYTYIYIYTCCEALRVMIVAILDSALVLFW